MFDVAQDAPKPVTSSNDTVARPGIPPLHNIGIKLRVRRPTSPGSSQASAEDTPLFMASELVRKGQRSLSPISNRAPRKKSRQSKPDAKMLDDDSALENMAWDIINREISEWQKVCQTGRPSWWLPVPKWSQRGARSTWQEEVHAITPCCVNLDNCHRPGQRYDEPRRAVTDSYLADNNNVQDMEHLIAVQLLVACFTLPPEHLSSYTTSAYHCFDTPGSEEMPNSRLISSLRMHMEAGHSPSFRHQAHNTSPTHRQQGAYDSPSPSRSRGSSSDQQVLHIAASRKASRERRMHRALHVTEGSTVDCSMDSHLELCDLSDILPIAVTNTWHRLKDSTVADQTIESSVLDRNTKSCPSTPGESDSELLRSSRLATEIFRGHTSEKSWTPANTRPAKRTDSARWRTLCRRVEYGLGYVHHDPISRRSNAISLVSASSRSTPAKGSVGSQALSSDGKERRRQARLSGDIHSKSIESGPRYSTPTSVAESGVTGPAHLEHPLPEISYTKGLGVAEAIANAFADSALTTAVSLCFTPPNSKTSSIVPSSPAITAASLSSRTDSEYFIGPTTSNSKPVYSPLTSSTRRHGQRRHQRSNLSEICAPEEIEERIVLSGLGSPLTSPKEEFGSEAAGGFTSNIPKLELEVRVSAIGQIPQGTIESRLKEDEKIRLELLGGNIRRPSIVRTSTSGTQVFTPSRDGVELDGLPTGPPSETWNDQGQGNKREIMK